MKSFLTFIGIGLVVFYAWAEWTGWELPSAKKGIVPASARTTGGFRSYRFWTGGK